MKRILALALVLLWIGARGASFSLEQCVDSALRLNPAVNAAALQVEKARLLKATAFDPPMTEVTLKQETTGGGGPENGVYFGQEFDFPTLYVARHRSLQARSSLEAARYDVMMAETEREVALGYYELVYVKELLRLNSELGAEYERFCRIAGERLALGEAGPLEEMNARMVHERNEMERRDWEVRYESAMLQLQRLTGIAEAIEPVAGMEDAPLNTLLPLDQMSDFDFGQTRRGRASSWEVEMARKEEMVARNEFLPGIKIGATAQALIKSFNPYGIERLPFEKGNFMGFEVGITVPLFFGSKTARLKAASAERRISLLNQEAAGKQADAEWATLKARVSSLERRIEYFRNVALPGAAEMGRIAEVSYSFSDIDYVEYMANIENVYTVYRDYASCLNEYNLTLIELKNLCM